MNDRVWSEQMPCQSRISWYHHIRLQAAKINDGRTVEKHTLVKLLLQHLSVYGGGKPTDDLLMHKIWPFNTLWFNGRYMHCASALSRKWLRYSLIPCLVSSYYLDWFWFITWLTEHLQWKLNHNSRSCMWKCLPWKTRHSDQVSVCQIISSSTQMSTRTL